MHSMNISSRPSQAQQAASEAAAAQLRRRFLGAQGVVMHLFECALAGCIGHGREPNSFFERCVRLETSSIEKTKEDKLQTTRAASLLRWDLPAALFLGGRCTSPAATERHLYPPLRSSSSREWFKPDAFSWRSEGFSGHNVTQAGVGWVFKSVPDAQRGVAFSHDAWTADTSRRQRCAPSRSDTPEYTRAYATARLAATMAAHAPANDAARPNAMPKAVQLARGGLDANAESSQPPHPLQQMSDTFRREFVKSQWNCFHTDWEAALAAQRAYVAAAVGVAPSSAAECSVWGSLCERRPPDSNHEPARFQSRARASSQLPLSV